MTWTLLAGTALSGDTVVTVHAPAASASARETGGGLARRAAPLLLGMLLLPFAGRMRRGGRRLSRISSLVLLFVFGLGAAALAGLTGCGGGFFGQLPKTSTATVTISSGALTRTTTFTVTVE